MTWNRRRLARDKRGVGVAEYALLLFLIVAVVGISFKYMGRNVKHAGDKTEEQFAGGGGQSGKGGQGGAAGADSAGGASTAGAAGTAAGAGGAGNNAAAANGAGGKGASAGGKASHTGAAGGGGDDTADEADGTPIWKIVGGVIVGLFLVAGYFAFRKQKGSG